MDPMGNDSCFLFNFFVRDVDGRTFIAKSGQTYRIIMVLVLGGRDFIILLESNIYIYTRYISGIYCQLDDYILPIPPFTRT